MTDALVRPVRDGDVTAEKITTPSTQRPEVAAAPIAVPSKPPATRQTEGERLATLERRALRVIQWIVYGGVILLTLGAGALSWSHLTHIAEVNGHVAPNGLLFLFPLIIDGFMALSSAVVVRHALTDELGWRTWYAGSLAGATAALSICLNIQDSTSIVIVADWVLPGIAPALYMLGTELGLTELRRAMRKLRSQALQGGSAQVPETPQTKKEIVLGVLGETDGNVPEALALLNERGVQVDRSYVYEIKRMSIRNDSL